MMAPERVNLIGIQQLLMLLSYIYTFPAWTCQRSAVKKVHWAPQQAVKRKVNAAVFSTVLSEE